MSYPQNSIHPLERQGTTQRERLLKAILPENLLLDDRNMADLLAFAGEYAKQVRYWDENNSPDGDWTSFWEQDTTALLAIVAATDLDQLQVKYRSTELDFVKACKKEKRREGIPYCEKALVKLHELVVQIWEVAVLIENIYDKLPQNHSIRTEIGALIQGKLGIADKFGKMDFDNPLGELISYHKGIGNDAQLSDQYQTLIANPEIWGLTIHDFLNCIDYRQITQKDQEDLWRLFLDFFKVLTLIVSKAEKAFQMSLNGRGNHPPHIALFLSFGLLFRRYHQASLNGMVGKHLDYYYRDVLRLQERREIPDRVHLVFEIAQDLETHRLEKDTLLLGGQDTNGNDLLYGLTDELIVNQAKLVEKQNLYFYQDGPKLVPVALRMADRKDGFKQPFAKGLKLWHPLWGAGLYKKFTAKMGLLNKMKLAVRSLSTDGISVQQQRNNIVGRPGFLISSPELFLAKGGVRQINISGINSDVLENFDIEISTKEKSVNIEAGAYTSALNFNFLLHTTKPEGDGEHASEVEFRLNGQLWFTSKGIVKGYASIDEVGEDSNNFLELVFKVPAQKQEADKPIFFTGVGKLTENSMTINSLEVFGEKLDVNFTVAIKDGKVEEITTEFADWDFRTFGNATFAAEHENTRLAGSLSKSDLRKSVQLILPSDFPDIEPLKTDPWVPQAYPFLSFKLKNGVDLGKITAISLGNLAIQTGNSNLKNINIQLGDTVYTPTSEIPLVGTNTGPTKFSLYAIAPELSAKKISNAVMTLPPVNATRKFAFKRNQQEDTVFHKGQLEGTDLSALDLSTPVAYSVTTPHAYFKTDLVVGSNGVESPINVIRIPGQSISVSYLSEFATIGRENHKLYHIDYLGGYSEAREKTPIPARLIPAYDAPIGATQALTIEKRTADGNLRLGMENLLPGQTLSLLFNFAEGTGNPDRIAPDEMVWSYLRQNQWIRIPPQYILSDETLGLRKTGIIRFQIPADINQGNTLALGEDGRKDLYWLQASAVENPALNITLDALPQLKDIFAQAGTAVFENNNNDLAHIDKGLPASSITQLRFRDNSISKVEQPFVSFGGLHAESSEQQAYYRRIHERLRHKNRAITVWDYERLTLENFPKVALAKCLPHTRDTAVRKPGYVTLGVVPYPANMTGETKFYPIFNAGDLEAIEQFLNKLNSYFLSQKRGGVVCCCHSDEDKGCGCHGDDGKLLVRNAIFEPVRLQVCVKFRTWKEELFYKKQLNNDLKAFLAPWATDDHTPLVFGTRIYTVELLRFLENLDYIDVVLGIKVKHFPNREMAENNEEFIDFEEVETIEPFTSRSLLTTYLDLLNEDNVNVLDHQILIAGEADCKDCGC